MEEDEDEDDLPPPPVPARRDDIAERGEEKESESGADWEKKVRVMHSPAKCTGSAASATNCNS